MIKNKIYHAFVSVAMLVAIGVSATSCLDKYPNDAIPADKAINTLDELDQAAIGLYALIPMIFYVALLFPESFMKLLRFQM